jgi:DNA replication protein DnaC
MLTPEVASPLPGTQEEWPGTNLHPSGLDTIMPKTLATATVDRLLHHAHLVLTEGKSLRLAEATAGKGVTPLT